MVSFKTWLIDLPILQYKDSVIILHRLGFVGQGDDCFLLPLFLHQHFNHFADLLACTRCRFIDDQQLLVTDQTPGKAEQLLLAC